MKNIILLLTLFFVFCSTEIKAESLTLKQIVDTAMLRSPIIRNIDGNIAVAEEAKKLVSSYHYPVINFTQSLMRSDNPVNVFAFKLGQEQFAMSDFDINALNNPNPRTNNQSSFTLFLPIYTGGEISRKHSSVSKQLESAEYQKAWAKKVVRRNIYTLYYAIVNMDLTLKFLDSENEYLERLLKYYDAKSGANKNRYLSYNKGRIIEESIAEAKDELLFNINKMIADMAYLSGIENLSYQKIDINSEDLLKDFNWKNKSAQESGFTNHREDLLARSSYMESLKYEASSEKSKILPSIGSFVNYSINTQKFDTYGKDYTFGVKLSWDFGLFSFRTASLVEAKKISAEYEYDRAKKEVESENLKLKEDLNILESKIIRLENKQKLFGENKKILTSQYQKGSIDLYNLLDNFAHYIQNKGELHKLITEYKNKQITYYDNNADGRI